MQQTTRNLKNKNENNEICESVSLMIGVATPQIAVATRSAAKAKCLLGRVLIIDFYDMSFRKLSKGFVS